MVRPRRGEGGKTYWTWLYVVEVGSKRVSKLEIEVRVLKVEGTGCGEVGEGVVEKRVYQGQKIIIEVKELFKIN